MSPKQFTPKAIADREKRRASIHEAAHAYVCRLYGGIGQAEVWRNTDKAVANGETAWRGRFILMAEPGTADMDDATKEELGILPAPGNWKVLYGMAGLVAEQIDGGESDVDLIFEAMMLAVDLGEVSQTDLAAMGERLLIQDVAATITLLTTGWQIIEREAASLTA